MVNRFIERRGGLKVTAPVFAASASLTLLSLLMPLAILLIFDRIIPFQSTETLSLIACALLISSLLEFTLRWARSVLLSHDAQSAAVHNHQVFLDQTLEAEPQAFKTEPPAAHLERYAAIGRIRDYFAGQNQALAIDLPFTGLFILLVGLLGGWLILVPLITFAAVLLFALFMRVAQRLIFDKRKVLDMRRYAFLSEVLSHMLTVKANTMERQMTRRFELLRDQTVDASHSLILFSGFAQNYGAVLSQLATAAMGIVGAYFVINEAIGIAELAACMLLNGRITQPLLKLMSFWVQSESLNAARDKLADVATAPARPAQSAALALMEGSINLTNMVLSDDETEHVIASSATCRITPGQIVLFDVDDARTFPALIETLTGQRAAFKGSTRIDGVCCYEGPIRRGAHGLAVLEQDPAVFTGSLIDNLCAFGGTEQVKRAKLISSELGLEKRINRLPLGYDTEMNTGNAFEKDPVNRQLIALVRVLALSPKIVIANEPSSVLGNTERDALAQCLVQLSPRPTLLIASPDPRFRRIADQFIPLLAPSLADLEAWQADLLDEAFILGTAREDAA